MQADLIFIGDELLTGLVENSNAGYLSRRLWAEGIPVREQRVVSDDLTAIAGAIAVALENSDFVICTGGLGPTDDDLTREAAARQLHRSLILNDEWLSRLESFFQDRGLAMPASNRKQAMVLEGSILLDNPRGTAPGAVLECLGKLFIMLPGPPEEMQPMFEEEVLPLLKERVPAEIFMTKTLKCVGLGESLLEEKIKVAGEWVGLPLSLIARGFEVQLQLKARGTPLEAQRNLEAEADRLRSLLGSNIFGEDDDTLTGVVAKSLVGRKLTLGVAESCSGGLLADLITDVPGISRYFKGSVTAYSSEAKQNLLEVPNSLIEQEGAVSKGVTEAMALGACKALNADIGVAITGIAGPDSDISGRRVGLTYVATAWGDFQSCREFSFRGTRRAVKERAVQAALTMLLNLLTDKKR